MKILRLIIVMLMVWAYGYGAEAPVVVPISNVGLRNLGNTCFMNATLQALFHLLRLREAVLEARQAITNSMDHDAAKSFLALLDDYTAATSGSGALRPEGFYQHVWPRFQAHQPMIDEGDEEVSTAEGQQQDPNEFLQHFFSFFDGLGQHTEAINDIFRMTFASLITHVHGTTNHQRRLPEEASLTLELPIVGCTTLRDCFDTFSRPEELTGGNAVRCEACDGVLRDSTKTLLLTTLPCVLIVSFKRSTGDAVAGGWFTGRKDARGVSFPMRLLFRSANHGDLNYDLVSIVVHGGATALSGHYWAYARYGGAAAWWCFDDASAFAQYTIDGDTQIHNADDAVQGICRTGIDNSGLVLNGGTPYLLFYQLVEGAAPQASDVGWHVIDDAAAGGVAPPPPPVAAASVAIDVVSSSTPSPSVPLSTSDVSSPVAAPVDVPEKDDTISGLQKILNRLKELKSRLEDLAHKLSAKPAAS